MDFGFCSTLYYIADDYILLISDYTRIAISMERHQYGTPVMTLMMTIYC